MRILMLGNSLTTANGLPDKLAERLQAQVVVHARGGARLSEHLNPRTKLGAKTQAALRDLHWDYVVLQEMSNAPMRFPDRFQEAVRALCAAARGAGATPVLYSTWAYAPTCPKLAKLGVSAAAMHERMDEAARRAAEDAGALLADACGAFHVHADREALYAADGVHPSVAGTEVAVRAIADAIGRHGESHARTPKPYTVYLLECEDGSFYTGITTDMDRRFQEHRSRGPKAARYTRTHPVVRIAATWEAADRAEASRLEYRIKQLSHDEKATLAENPDLAPLARSACR